jgi:hypothetical protein
MSAARRSTDQLDIAFMRLTKEQSRTRWSQARDLWWTWDPIGVGSEDNWPRDEYDAYLGPTFRLLEKGAPSKKLRDIWPKLSLEEWASPIRHARSCEDVGFQRSLSSGMNNTGPRVRCSSI